MSAFFVGFRAPGGAGVVAYCDRGHISLLLPIVGPPGQTPGWDWGRSSSGALALAGAILWRVTGDTFSVLQFSRCFRGEMLAAFADHGFTLTVGQVLAWIEAQQFTSEGDVSIECFEMQGGGDVHA